MNVSDSWRDSQSIWAEHRRDIQVLSAILDNRHASGKGFGQRRIDDDLCCRLFAGERDNLGEPTSVLVLCAEAGIAHSTMAATDNRDMLFEHVYFAMFFPRMRSLKSKSDL